jgi:hypothetical protein
MGRLGVLIIAVWAVPALIFLLISISRGIFDPPPPPELGMSRLELFFARLFVIGSACFLIGNAILLWRMT